MTTRRVLVTGASGFIGRQAVPLLQDAGYEVHAAMRNFLPGVADLAKTHVCDLLVAGEAARLVGEVCPTHLLHLAWNAVPGVYWTTPENLTWVARSLDLLESFARAGGGRAVFAGTCAEYDWSHELLSESSTPLRPGTLYGHAKNALREVVLAAANGLEVSAAWGRVFFLYGPYEPDARLLPHVIGALLRGEVAECTHGRQERDFMFVKDVARAFVQLLDHRFQGAVNIASGVTHSLAEVIQEVADQLNRPDLVKLGARPASPNEPLRLSADVDVLRNEIRFVPEYSLREGISETIASWRRES